MKYITRHFCTACGNEVEGTVVTAWRVVPCPTCGEMNRRPRVEVGRWVPRGWFRRRWVPREPQPDE